MRDKINDFSQIEGSDPNATDNELVEVLDEQYDVLKGANALAVVTEWNQFRNPDFSRIKEELSAPIVFDGRNLYSPELLAEKGFAYFCIGRRAKGEGLKVVEVVGGIDDGRDAGIRTPDLSVPNAAL